MEKKIAKIGVIAVLMVALILSSLGMLNFGDDLSKGFNVAGYQTAGGEYSPLKDGEINFEENSHLRNNKLTAEAAELLDWTYPTSTPAEPIFAVGTGDEGSPYEISTPQQLANLSYLVYFGNTNYNGKHYKLTADIVLNDTADWKNWDDTKGTKKAWEPIGSGVSNFLGTFDGAGHTVSGIYAVRSSVDYVGLFGNTSAAATIKNVGVVNSYIKGRSYVGGVVGLAYGTVSDCYNTGKVFGEATYLGGVAGCVYGANAKMTGCYNAGEVKGKSYIGGVVGYNNSATVEKCFNNGAVNGTEERVGGVVGENNGTVKGCYNTGKTEAGIKLCGGVVGSNYGKVSDSYNGGAVSGNNNVGGVAGGYPSLGKMEIINCYNTGDVTGTAGSVGGVAGSLNGNITNCYNTGAVKGDSSAGGVVGYCNDGVVTNCINIGAVVAPQTPGGVIGNNNNGIYTNCYYLQTDTINKNIPANTYTSTAGVMRNLSAFNDKKQLITAGGISAGSNEVLVKFAKDADLKTTLMAGAKAYNVKNAKPAIQAAPWVDDGKLYPVLGVWVKIDKIANSETPYSGTDMPFAITGIHKDLVTYVKEYKPTGAADTAYTTTSPINVGEYDVKITSVEQGKYAASEFLIPKGVNITKMPLAVTASSHAVVFGDAIPTYTVTYTGFVNGETDVVLTTKPTIACGYKTDSPAGTPINVIPSGAVGANYDITYTNGVVTIAKKALARPTVVTGLVYDKTVQTGVNPATALEGYTYAGHTGTNAGSAYTATATLDVNYKWSTQVGGSDTEVISLPWTIEKKALARPTVVTGLVYDKTVQTGVNPATALEGYTYAGHTGTNAGSAYTATATLDVNYKWSTPNGADYEDVISLPWTIATKAITGITAQKVYSVGNKAFSVTLKSTNPGKNCDGLIDGDVVTIAFDTISDAAGIYAGGQITNYSVGGAGRFNYLVSKGDVTAKITGAPLDPITGIPTGKIYNGAAQVPTVALGGAVIDVDYTLAWTFAADGTTFFEVNGAPEFKNAGTYRVVANGIGNHLYATQTADYVIAKKGVTVEWTAPASFEYTGNAIVLKANVTPSDLAAGDGCAVIASVTGAGDNTNVTGMAFTYTASGLSNPNYKITAGATSGSYTITIATNAWTTPLSMPTAYVNATLNPTAAAKFGTVEFTYYGADENGAQLPGAIATPTAIGTYYITAKVAGTTNYTELAEGATPALQFKITKRPSGGDGGASTITTETVFWNGVVNELDYKLESVIAKDCNYAKIPQNVLLALQGSDKTLDITMNGERLVVTSQEVKELTFDKSAYTIAEVKAMLAEKPEVTPTPTEKPTEPTEPTAPDKTNNLTWLWVLLGIIAISAAIVVTIVLIKKKKNKQ